MTRPDIWKLRALVAGCALVCLSGILIGGFVTHCPNDGGRGGAVTVAAAFAVLFIKGDYGSRLKKLRAEAAKIRKKIGLLSGETDSKITNQGEREEQFVTHGYIRSMGKEQNTRDHYLAWISVVGTLVWGFGDWIVSGILHCRGIAKAC